MSNEPIIEFAYTFCEQTGDSNLFWKGLKDFKKGKKIIKEVIQLMPIPAGMSPLGGGQMRAEIKIIPCAFLVFETTQKEVDTFLFNLKMAGKH